MMVECEHGFSGGDLVRGRGGGPEVGGTLICSSGEDIEFPGRYSHYWSAGGWLGWSWDPCCTVAGICSNETAGLQISGEHGAAQAALHQSDPQDNGIRSSFSRLDG